MFYKVDQIIEPLRKIAENLALPIMLLLFRMHVAAVFLSSGLSRLDSFLKGAWDTQVFLFELEHPVPGLSPNMAAVITTGAELILPLLLLFGLFGRVGAAGLLVMTTVIEFTYSHQAAALDLCLKNTGLLSCIYRPDHLIWASMLLPLLIIGSGKFSLDFWMVKWVRASAKKPSSTIAEKE